MCATHDPRRQRAPHTTACRFNPTAFDSPWDSRAGTDTARGADRAIFILTTNTGDTIAQMARQNKSLEEIVERVQQTLSKDRQAAIDSALPLRAQTHHFFGIYPLRVGAYLGQGTAHNGLRNTYHPVDAKIGPRMASSSLSREVTPFIRLLSSNTGTLVFPAFQRAGSRKTSLIVREDAIDRVEFSPNIPSTAATAR